MAHFQSVVCTVALLSLIANARSTAMVMSGQNTIHHITSRSLSSALLVVHVACFEED